jgi:hypothetical protein
MTVNTKFELGQTVWAMYINEPREFLIAKIYAEAELNGKTKNTYEINVWYSLHLIGKTGQKNTIHENKIHEGDMKGKFYISKKLLLDSFL